MLTKNDFENNWPEIKGGLKNFWGRLTDEEIDAVKKNIFELTELIQSKYGESKEEINEKIQRLLTSFDNDTDKGIDPDVSSYHRSPLY